MTTQDTLKNYSIEELVTLIWFYSLSPNNRQAAELADEALKELEKRQAKSEERQLMPLAPNSSK